MNSAFRYLRVVGLFALCHGALGQGLTTLICQSHQTNQIQINSSQTAKIQSYYDTAVAAGGADAPSFVRIQSGTNVINLKARGLLPSSNSNDGVYTPDFTIAGPATISLIGAPNDGFQAILTLDIQPAPFPPGKAVTIGANSGNVQVTMEMSTDLVNWTPAVNAMVYTNSPDARFFRIKLVTNASP